MSTGNAAEKKERAKVLEMLLSSPGMQEHCKVSLKFPRQNALLLCKLIEAGFLSKKNLFEEEFMGSLSEDLVKEFKSIQEEILSKAGLTDFYEKLKSF